MRQAVPHLPGARPRSPGRQRRGGSRCGVLLGSRSIQPFPMCFSLSSIESFLPRRAGSLARCSQGRYGCRTAVLLGWGVGAGDLRRKLGRVEGGRNGMGCSRLLGGDAHGHLREMSLNQLLTALTRAVTWYPFRGAAQAGTVPLELANAKHRSPKSHVWREFSRKKSPPCTFTFIYFSNLYTPRPSPPPSQVCFGAGEGF